MPDVYLAAARALGADPDESHFRNRLNEIWSRRNDAMRTCEDDLRSSDALEREGWRRLTWQLARPFSDLAGLHGPWLESLFRHFDSPNAWRVVAGAGPVLDALRQRGIATAVVSNWHTALHRLLEAHGLRSRVSMVVTSAEVGFKKPHPRIFKAALEQLGCQTHEAVHVGDSWEDDVLGARALGIEAVYVCRNRAAAAANTSDLVRTVHDLAALSPEPTGQGTSCSVDQRLGSSQ